jgi:RNA polymerase-binding transcription factor DksA
MHMTERHSQTVEEKAKSKLEKRLVELRSDIQRELIKRDHELYGDLVDKMSDSSDASVADLLIDVNLAEIARDLEELRDVESALRRIELGTFGVCTQCSGDIQKARLETVPEASRCFSCQTAEEGKNQRDSHLKM